MTDSDDRDDGPSPAAATTATTATAWGALRPAARVRARLMLAAFHEAGHALVNRARRVPTVYVFVERSGRRVTGATGADPRGLAADLRALYDAPARDHFSNLVAMQAAMEYKARSLPPDVPWRDLRRPLYSHALDVFRAKTQREAEALLEDEAVAAAAVAATEAARRWVTAPPRWAWVERFAGAIVANGDVAPGQRTPMFFGLIGPRLEAAAVAAADAVPGAAARAQGQGQGNGGGAMSEATPPTAWVCDGCGRALPDDPEGYRRGDSYGFGAYDDGHPDGTDGDAVFRYWCSECTDADIRREEAFVVRVLADVFGDARAEGRR